MEEINLQTIKNPQEAVFKLLSCLDKRSSDIIVRRFGIKDGSKETLEKIGQSYGLTRERVRQIENNTLASLRERDKLKYIKPLEEVLFSLLQERGGVVERHTLLNLIQNKLKINHPNLFEFILELSPRFIRFKEDKEFKQAWAISTSSFIKAKKIIQKLIDYLKKKNKPVSQSVLTESLRENMNEEIKDTAILSYLNLSKHIKRNPFGEWGLSSWGTISPQGVKDKAYLVLVKKNRPMHFREIAKAINEIGFDKRRATCRTIHNALIKDPRFVLVGRGIYALSEAGFRAGTVADIVAYLLEKGPKTKEEIIFEVLKQRIVKKNTIILALQDKTRFKKIGDKYYLIQK